MNKIENKTQSLWASLMRLRMFFSRSDKKRYLILLLMMMTGAILETVGIGIIPAILALLTSTSPLSEHAIISRFIPTGITPSNLQILTACVLISFAFILAKIAYFSYYLHLKNRLVARHQIELSHRLFSAYINAPLEFHLEKNSAEPPPTPGLRREGSRGDEKAIS